MDEFYTEMQGYFEDPVITQRKSSSSSDFLPTYFPNMFAIDPQEMVINISNKQPNASFNEILSKQNSTKPDEVILVKNDGILPGADAFPPPFPQRHGGRTTNAMGGSSPGSFERYLR